MIQYRCLNSIGMVHNACDGKEDHGMPCLMGSWTAWPIVGWDKKVVQKSVFLTKKKQVGHTTFLVWLTGQL